MFKTEISDMLNIKYPIIQGGMAWIATAELAGAVSNAGGLGIIGCGNAPASIIKKEIDKIRKITNKPFGVNVMFLSPFLEEIIDMLLEEKVPVITTGAGNPGKYIERFKEIGTKVIPVIPTVALAKRMEKLGADAIIVEGTEAGGHIGELSTMALLPQIVDAVDIPVIAAGGIADGRGFVAALSLGAKGVQIGTRFVCTDECIAHDKYKEAIVKAGDRDAIVTGRSTGHPVRVIKNQFTKDFIKREKENESPEELVKFGEGALEKAAIHGDIKNGTIMAGQISSLISDVKSCKEVIEGIIVEAEEVRKRLVNI